MISEKLLINLEKVIMPVPNNVELIILQYESLFKNRKQWTLMSQQVPPNPDHAMLRGMVYKGVTPQITYISNSLGNVKFYDTLIRNPLILSA